MNPSTMTREELEDTVVILQHICLDASRTINEALLELRYGIPVRSVTMLNDALYQLTNAPRRPLNGSRIDQNHSTYTEVA
jgi:hypothetical protein